MLGSPAVFFFSVSSFPASKQRCLLRNTWLAGQRKTRYRCLYNFFLLQFSQFTPKNYQKKAVFPIFSTKDSHERLSQGRSQYRQTCNPNTWEADHKFQTSLELPSLKKPSQVKKNTMLKTSDSANPRISSKIKMKFWTEARVQQEG